MPCTPFPAFRRSLGGALIVAALLVVTSIVGGARPALALTNCSVSDMAFDAEEQEFLRLINQYRGQNGRAALTVSVNLNRAASWMARDLAVNRYFSHTDSLGRAPSTRIANCDGNPYTGENIAAGTIKDTAAEAFELWRTSSGHNANMLNGSYKQIGIARYYDAGAPYRWYWVTDFSTTNDGTNDGTNAGGSGGGGGGTARAPTLAPQPPAAPTNPMGVMTSPADGSTLGGTATFAWEPGTDSSVYYFYMGTYAGGSNMLSVSMGSAHRLTVQGLPATGGVVYVRLWSLTPEGWRYVDYTYRLAG